MSVLVVEDFGDSLRVFGVWVFDLLFVVGSGLHWCLLLGRVKGSGLH